MKFYVQLKKLALETVQIRQEAYGNENIWAIRHVVCGPDLVS